MFEEPQLFVGQKFQSQEVLFGRKMRRIKGSLFAFVNSVFPDSFIILEKETLKEFLVLKKYISEALRKKENKRKKSWEEGKSWIEGKTGKKKQKINLWN